MNPDTFTLSAATLIPILFNTAFYVSDSDVTLDGVSVNYTAPDEVDAYAVYATAADNFALINSEIVYVSVNPGAAKNYGLEVRDSSNVLIKNNKGQSALRLASSDMRKFIIDEIKRGKREPWLFQYMR